MIRTNSHGLTFEQYTGAVRSQLESGLPGSRYQMLMAPDFIPPHHQNSPVSDAAVMILLLPVNQEPALLLIRRKTDTSVHSGQISLPGGKRELYDRDLIHTAVRETAEETGFPIDKITVLGTLTRLLIAVSRFDVLPVVGCSPANIKLTPNTGEVEEIYKIPVSRLTEEKSIIKQTLQIRGHAVEVPGYSLSGTFVWGATAMILSEFMEIHHRAISAHHP